MTEKTKKAVTKHWLLIPVLIPEHVFPQMNRTVTALKFYFFLSHNTHLVQIFLSLFPGLKKVRLPSQR